LAISDSRAAWTSGLFDDFLIVVYLLPSCTFGRAAVLCREKRTRRPAFSPKERTSMASVSRDRSGNYTVQFMALDGKRKSVRFGRMAERAAEVVRFRVEAICAAQKANLPVDGETATWLAGLGDDLHSRFAAAGLVAPRAAANARLGAFIDGYITGRKDVKPRTVLNLQAASARLVEFFGADRLLRDVKAGEADDFCV
jgi:hypothetical protein